MSVEKNDLAGPATLDSVILGNDHLMNRISFALKAGLSFVAAFAVIALPVWLILLALFASKGALGEVLTITAAKLITLVGGGNFPLRISLDGENFKAVAGQIATGLDARYARHLSVFFLTFVVAALPAGFALKRVARLLQKTGAKMQTHDHLRGAKLASPAELNQAIAQQQDEFRELLAKNGQILAQPVMKLQIGDVTLPDNHESAGFLLLGSTGSGKTVAQKALCRQVREKDQKMIIYDPAPEFVCEFWRPGDIIINPFDQRSAPWSIWKEIRKVYDYKAFSEAIVDLDAKYANFSQSARLVLAAVLQKTGSLAEFKRALALPLEEMEDFLVDSVAEGVISAANSRGSATVMGIIRQKVSAFYFMRDPAPGEVPFSFRDWVSDDNDKRWIFLVSPEDQRSILAPLITLYLEMIAREIMTLTPNNALPLEKQRRVWLMLEELPSLPIIPSLEGLTAKGRKYGAVWVLTAQDPGQIEKTYSKELAAAIMQCCNTWLVFRANAAETAKRVSMLIGQYEEIEKRISHSMGVEENKDGTSVTKAKIVRDAVLPSEIQTLQNLEHYLIIFGPYPRCKQFVPFESAPVVQPAIVLRDDVSARGSFQADATVPAPDTGTPIRDEMAMVPKSPTAFGDRGTKQKLKLTSLFEGCSAQLIPEQSEWDDSTAPERRALREEHLSEEPQTKSATRNLLDF